MGSTEHNSASTGCQSPPRPPSRRLPAVAPGVSYRTDTDVFNPVKNRAGSTLAEPHFGPKDGVHLSAHSAVTLFAETPSPDFFCSGFGYAAFLN